MKDKTFLEQLQQSFLALTNSESAFNKKIEEIDSFMQNWDSNLVQRLGNYDESTYNTNNSGPKINHRNFFQFSATEQDKTPDGSIRHSFDINENVLGDIKKTEGYQALHKNCKNHNINLEVNVYRQEIGSQVTDPASYRVEHHIALEFKTDDGTNFRDSILQPHQPSAPKMEQNI